MTSRGELQDALLELGLEDLIPLWEPVGVREVDAATSPETRVEEIAAALQALLAAGRIHVFAGGWDEEPSRVDPGAAETLLQDSRRYSATEESEEGLDRVYFVNVENWEG